MRINLPESHIIIQRLILALLLMTWLSVPSLAADPIGQVVSMTGSVKALQTDGGERTLDLDSPVYAQEKLVTGPTSNVEVRLLDETILAQGPDSTIFLDEYVYSPDPSASKLLFKMGAGTFRFLSGKIVKQNPSAFELQTPMTTIGIRGTEPVAKVGPTEVIGLLSIEPGHIVEVATAKGTLQMNKPGTSINVGKGGAMSPPAPMPKALKRSIMQAAPMTTQGEVGTKGKKEDLERKVKAFKQNIGHAKGGLGDVSGPPDYGKLHNIHMQALGQKQAESQRDGTDASISTTGGSGSDGSGSGSGDHGGQP